MTGHPPNIKIEQLSGDESSVGSFADVARMIRSIIPKSEAGAPEPTQNEIATFLQAPEDDFGQLPVKVFLSDQRQRGVSDQDSAKLLTRLGNREVTQEMLQAYIPPGEQMMFFGFNKSFRMHALLRNLHSSVAHAL